MVRFFHITPSEITTFQWVAAGVFTVLFFVRVFYRLFFSLRVLGKRKMDADNNKTTPVSLLFTIRNEEANIRKNLPEILKIENADFEVVVIDDFSQDNSLSVLGTMKSVEKRIHVSSLNQETRYSVKLAQNIALKAAQNEWVLVVPVSVSGFGNEWLLRISERTGQDNTLILNYTNVSDGKGFYRLLYRVESFIQQFKSVGYCKAGLPFVYSEINVAFRKEKYFETGGYGQKVKEPYANLELIINSFIKKKETDISFVAETSVWKGENITRDDYYDLLNKSIRIENYLTFGKRAVLFTDELSKLLFIPVLLLVIVFLPELWLVYTVLSVLLFVLYLLIIKFVLNRLNERKLFLSSLAYDLLAPYFKGYYRWHFRKRSENQKWRSKI
jgi:glycosyltransferase involved in cell wall biosynthesis